MLITESYDGSSWTEVADLNQARRKLKGIGTATASLAVGGSNPGVLANVEQWDGSSWTEVSDINSARELMSMSGTSTAAYRIWWRKSNCCNYRILGWICMD